MAAVVFAFRKLGLVVEASSAVVLAAVISGQIQATPETVLVVTGGNIDAELLDGWLAATAT